MWSTWWWYGSLFYHKFMYDKRMIVYACVFYGLSRGARVCASECVCAVCMSVGRVMDGRCEMYLDKYQRHKNITQQHLMHLEQFTVDTLCRLRLSNFVFNNILSKIFRTLFKHSHSIEFKSESGKKCHTSAQHNTMSIPFFLSLFSFLSSIFRLEWMRV